MRLPIRAWKKTLSALGLRLRQPERNRPQRQSLLSHTHQIETLEPRQLLDGGGLDFADAPASYPVTLAEDGARHGDGASYWVQQGSDIDGEAEGDASGTSVSLSSDGQTVAICAPGNDGSGTSAGHTRIYTWDGAAWNQLGSDIDGEEPGDYSGSSVSISGDGSTVAISAPGNDDNGTDSGHTRIYRWDGGAWNQLGNDIDGEAEGDYSGDSVSISGDGNTVAIGAPNNDGNGVESGQTRIYRWDGAAWNQLGSDIDGEASEDYSGYSVSISSDGNTVAIGAPNNADNGAYAGHTRIFTWDGAAWNQRGGDIDGEAAGDFSGWSVSISGDGSTVAIGAPVNDGNGSDSGHTRIYRWDGAAWNQLGSDIDGEASQNESGNFVSLSSDGNTVAIGAPYNDGNGSDSGHARIYRWDGGAWNQLGTDIDGEASGDYSGSSISISSDGGTVAIGARSNDGNGSNAGHTRIYRFTSLRLGESRDEEADGTHSAAADADGADEDGIVFGNLYAGFAGSVDVTVMGNAGLLDGWIDYNVDGDWSDAGEQIFASQSVSVGLNTLSVVVPSGASIGTTFARFRLSSAGGLGVVGEASDGEVEDYAVAIDTNTPPVFADQAFGIFKGSADGVLVGTLSATDANGDNLTYALTANVDPDGDGTDAFRVEGNQLLVNDPDDLAVADSPLTLTAQASDGNLATPATLTVAIYNDTLVVENLAFDLSDQATAGTVVGTLSTVFADSNIAGDVEYSLGNQPDPDGDGELPFSVDGDQLLVNDSDDLDAQTLSTVTFNYAAFRVATADNPGVVRWKSITVDVYDGLANGGAPPVVTEHTAAIFVSAENAEVAYSFGTAPGGVSYSFTTTVDPDGDGTAAFTIDQNQIQVQDSDELVMSLGHGFPELADWMFYIDISSVVSEAVPLGAPYWWSLNENSADRYGARVADRDVVLSRLPTGKIRLEVSEHLGGTHILTSIRDGNGDVVYSGISTFDQILDLPPQPLAPYTLKVADSDGDYHQVNVEINRPPVSEDHVFAIDENAAEGTVVGTLTTFDADADAVTLSLADGDYDGDGNAAFRVEGKQLLVNDAGDLGAWGTGDLDSDGIPDREDNAPDTYNPGQDDTDSDGIGDVVDEAVVSSWGYNLGGDAHTASSALDNVLFESGLNSSPDTGTPASTTEASGTGDDDLFNQLRLSDGVPLNLQIPVPTVGAEYQVTFYVAHPAIYNKGRQDISLEGVTAISSWDTGPAIPTTDYGTDDPRPLMQTANVVVTDSVLDVQVTPTAGWYPQFDYVMLSAIRIDELQSAAQVTGIQLTATASDGKHSDSAQISIKLNAAPDTLPPVFDNQSLSVPENSVGGTVIGTLVATDADGDSLTYSIANNVDPDGDGNDAFRVEGDQLLVNDSGDLDYETNPQLVITAEASDGSDTDTAQITITITDVNEAPTAVTLANAITSLPENTDLSADMKVADIVIVDDALGSYSVSLTGTEAHMFSTENDELFLIDDAILDYETLPILNVTVNVQDTTLPDSTPVTVDFAISVLNVNETPVAANDLYHVLTDGSITVAAPGVLENDSDPEGDFIMGLALVDDVQNGSLQISSDGSFTYTPEAGFEGNDTFTYLAMDASPTYEAGTVTLTVRPYVLFSDPTPTVEDHFGYSTAIDGDRVLIGATGDDSVGGSYYDAYTTEGQANLGQAHLFDLSGNLLQTFSPENIDIYSDPATWPASEFGKSVALDGDYVLISDPNESAAAVYLYDANTGNLLHTFSDPTPNTEDGTFPWDPYYVEDEYFGNFIAIEGDRVLIGDQRDDTLGTNIGQVHLFDAVSGNLIYSIDNPNLAGAYVNDEFGSQGAISENYLLVSEYGFHYDEPSFCDYVYLFNASDGSIAHTFENPTGRKWDYYGTAVALTDDYAVIGAWSYGGNEGAVYVHDTSSGSLLHTLHLPEYGYNPQFGKSVAIENDQIVVGGRTEQEGNFPVYCFDVVSGDLVQVISPASTNPSSDGFGVIAVDNGNVVVGAYHTDAPGNAVGEAYLYAIEPNVPLTFDDQTVSVAENSPEGTLVATLAATNVAGSVTYSLVENSNPDGVYNTNAFRLEGDQLLINDVNDFDYESLAQLQVTTIAYDGVTASQSIITVNVTDVIEPPTAVNDAYQTLANGDLTADAPGVLGNDTDADWEGITAALVSGTSNGTLSFNADGSFTYTPDADFVGDDTFTYQVSDGTNLSNVAAVSITVIPYVTFEDPTIDDHAEFGWATAIDGDRVLIGGFRDDKLGLDVGEAHLFDLQGNLLQTFDDPSVTTEDWFGFSVAISGDYVLISDSRDDTAGTDIGQVHLFDAATGNLLHTFSDPTPTIEDHFGVFVAINDGQILIGDSGDDTAAENSGQVHLFDASSRSLLRTIQNPNTTDPSNNSFGSVGDISDGRILVGATNDGIGRAHLFDASDGSLLHSFDDPTADNKDYFALSAALDGNYIVIGAFEDDTLLPSAGQAYVFDATTGLLLHTLDNPEPNNMEWFGEAVAIDGSRIVVGAMLNRVDGYQIGEAYLFDAVSGNLVRTFEEPTPSEFDLFGQGVAIDGDHVLIGAYGHRNTELDITTGEAYLYHLSADTPPVFDNQSFSVAENSADGTVVGTLAATDFDGDSLVYSIVTNVDLDGDGNGAFRIEGDQLLVNDTDDLDYEIATQLVITAEASDGWWSDMAQITINVTGVDEIPVITLLGDAVVNVDVDPGGTYSDPGATAADSLDGDLTSSIVLSGDVVNLKQAGSYTLHYNVSDAAGNAASAVTRTIHVGDPLVPGSGIFSGSIGIPTADPASAAALDVLAVDLDQDGDQDLVTLTSYTNGVIWYENDGAEVFTPHGLYGSYAKDDVIVADFNSDGYLDIVTANDGLSNSILELYPGDASTSFSADRITLGTGYYKAASADDFDGDGDTDIVTDRSWFENTGGAFTFTEHIYTTEESYRVYPVDLDQDGDLDIVADGAWYENDGSQNLTPHATLTGRHSQPIDLDGDGDIDIVSSDEINTGGGRQTSIYLLENDGAENFSTTQIVLSTRSAQLWDFRGPSMEVIDIDLDGDLDIPYADHGRVGILLNDGQQNFTDQILYASSEWYLARTSDLSVVDIDGDGDLDIFSGADERYWNPSVDDRVDWYRQVATSEIPVAADDAYQGLTNDDLTIDAPGVLGNDTDADGDGLTAALVSGTSNGALSLNADGSFTYTPDVGFVGDDTFTYQASDGAILSNVATVTITVIPYVTFEDPTIDDHARFGSATAIDGDRVLIGGFRDDELGLDVGEAHLFDLQGNLLQTFDDPSVTTQDWFGFSVAISGDYVLIGDTKDDTAGTDIGQVHLFDAATGNLLHTFSDPTPTTEDRFGKFVAIDGGQILIGAPGDDTVAENSGQVHLFDASTRLLLRTVENPNSVIPAADSFGSAGDISAGQILVGAPNNGIGRAHLFDASDGALLHSFDDPTGDEPGHDRFAQTVALDGNYIVIGANEDSTLAPSAGQAYVFDATTGSLLHTLDNPDPDVMEWFGEAVAIDGPRIVVGAMLNRVDGYQIGEAYLFDAVSGNLVRTFEEPTPSEFDLFGHGVAIDGDHVLIGAYRHRNIELDIASGEAYLYHLAADTPPVFDNQSFSVAENSADGTVVGTLAATDFDGDSLTYSIVTNVDLDGDGNGAFRIEGDQLLVNDRGDLDYEYQSQLQITAAAFDGTTADTAVITIDLTDVLDNAPPVFDDVLFTLPEHSAHLTAVGTLAASDPDPDALAYSFVTNADPDGDGNVAFCIIGDQLLVNDSGDFDYETNPQLVITLMVSDGSLTTDTAQITVDLTDVVENIPPVFDDVSFMLPENSPSSTVVGTLAATDADGDSLTYSLTGRVNPDGDMFYAFIVEGDQLLVNDSGDLDYEANSQLVITARASDGSEIDTAQVTINLTNVVEPPLANADLYSVFMNEGLTVDAPGVLGNDTLIESGALTAERIDDVQHGTLQFSADGSFTYQPDQNYLGEDAFTYRVNDGTTDSESVATVTLVVSSLLHTLDNPSDPYKGEWFGWSVSTDGNYVLVGAPRNIVGAPYSNTDGQAYLYDAATGDLLHSFDPPEGNDNGWDTFGSSVAVDGNLVLIGDPTQDVDGNTYTGQAYLYDATTGDLIHTIDDPAPTYSGRFASALAIDGNHILIGNSNHFVQNSGGGNESIGQAYLFDATTGVHLHTFDDPDKTGSDAFGVSVAIEGERILIGASGHDWDHGQAHLFDTTTGGLLHTFDNSPADRWDYFGHSVAIDGNHILIGEFGDNTQGEDVGQAHLFDATSYNLIRTFNDPTPTEGDSFGLGIALHDNIVLIGARKDDTKGTDVGQAHVFDALTGDLLQTLNDPTASEEDYFGRAVAAAGGYLVVGAYRHDTGSYEDIGQAHIFNNDFNARPFFAEQTFSVSENSGDGTLIGTLVATDADGDSLTYSIANNVDPDGDGNAAFRVEGDQLLVNDADDLDYETNPQLVITAEASDGTLSDTAQVAVNITAATTDPVIVDDGDAGFTQTGFDYFANPSLAGYETDWHRLKVEDGAGTASWTFTGLSSGQYQISATWPAKSNRASDVPFAVHTGSGIQLATASLNQQTAPNDRADAGSDWEDVTSVNFDGGTLVVSLSESPGETGQVVADAVRIERIGNAAPTLAISFAPNEIAESGGSATGTLYRFAGSVGDLVVDLASSDPASATVPASVTIPGGAASVDFAITAIDNATAEGDQTLVVTASAASYSDAVGSLIITDDEAHLLPQIIDNGSAGFAQSGFDYLASPGLPGYETDWHRVKAGESGDVSWSFTGLATGNYRVSATWPAKNNRASDADFVLENGSGDPLAITQINQKLAPASFAEDGTDWEDLAFVNVSDGAITVRLSESAGKSGQVIADAIRVQRTDDLQPGLALSFDASQVAEAAGTVTGTVSRGAGNTTGALVVTLQSTDSTEASVPANVTIADGASSAIFTLTGVDDASYDGDQASTIIATATGYVSGLARITTTDDEAPGPAIILDDGDSGFSQSGFDYFASPGLPGYETDWHRKQANDGAGEAQWHFTGLANGEYYVSATWRDKSNRANDAPYTIEDGAGTLLASASVNQRLAPATLEEDGTLWENLGMVLVDGGELVVKLNESPGATGQVVADAIALREVPPMTAIVDDGDGAFSQTGFEYLPNPSLPGYETDWHRVKAGDSGEASWSFSNLIEGSYRVSATWHEKSNRASDAPFVVENGTGGQLLSASLNQQLAPASFEEEGTLWQEVGMVSTIDGSLVVKLTESPGATGQVVADAIRIDRVGPAAELLLLSIAPSEASELGGTATGTVSRSETLGDLTVTLASGDLSEATVPQSVIIPDGQASATFTITTVDDDIADGTQEVQFTAAAEGYSTGSDTLSVTDNEPTPVIIDDGDANFSHTGFDYFANPALAGHETDWHRLQAGGTGEARWSFNNLTDGQYLVSATWQAKSNRASDAPFIIEDSSGAYLAAVAVNQQLAPDDRTDAGSAWKDLATVSVTGGTIAVKLSESATASGQVIADAVRIVRVGDLAGSSLSGSADAAFASEELLDNAFDELAGDWQEALEGDGDDPFGEFD